MSDFDTLAPATTEKSPRRKIAAGIVYVLLYCGVCALAYMLGHHLFWSAVIQNWRNEAGISEEAGQTNIALPQSKLGLVEIQLMRPDGEDLREAMVWVGADSPYETVLRFGWGPERVYSVDIGGDAPVFHYAAYDDDGDGGINRFSTSLLRRDGGGGFEYHDLNIDGRVDMIARANGDSWDARILLGDQWLQAVSTGDDQGRYAVTGSNGQTRTYEFDFASGEWVESSG